MNERGIKRQLEGIVVSDKMDKTVTVVVERLVKHKVYKKYVKRKAKFAVHDETNRCKEGDWVRIMECRPMSRLKRWRVVDVVQKAV
ncbi:MAG: 30S ribosomal protein S17 [Desulfosudaceae bacterium]